MKGRIAWLAKGSVQPSSLTAHVVRPKVYFCNSFFYI